MGGIVVAGRRVLAPLYRRVADTRNAELFAALTLLVVLGTSLVTQVAGLSLALGAFLAGLLLAETEFHLQVESDIAPYKGLLMGLFFMSVGMEISVQMLAARFAAVASAIALLLVGKVALMAAVGRAFGLSLVQSARAGLLLAPGGEFAFVLLGEAMARGILGAALVKEVYLVVALSMALTPYLAEAGAQLARRLERKDMKALAASSAETAGLSNHVIIAGFGRTGKLLAQLLGEQMIPYVALDLSAARVQEGRALDLPVYFGDAGSPAVLHSVGAGRARCAIVTLDTPGSSYRSVYSMHKNFPAVKTFATAQDAPAGLMLERAGATAVVPEVLEPSLQLAAAVLAELAVPEDDVAEVLRGFRKAHLAEFQLLAAAGGTSLGAGA
jgi:voltage-gated potassium channel Kch